MTEALKNAEDPSAQGRSASNEVACRAAFRLATYADSLYRAVQEQISSPKWATAVAIIQDKKRQVGTPACPGLQASDKEHVHSSSSFLQSPRVHLYCHTKGWESVC